MRVAHGDTERQIAFLAVSSADLATRLTSLSGAAVYYSLDGGAATAVTTPTIAALDATNMPGWFSLALDEAGMVALGVGVEEGLLALYVTATGMRPVDIAVEVARQNITAAQAAHLDAAITSREASGAAASAVGGLNDLDAQAVRDAMKLAPTAGDQAEGSVDEHLDAIPTTAAPTAASVADAVWDEATSGHSTAGTFGAWASGLAAAVWAYATRTLTSWSNLVASLTASQITGAINASRNVTRYYGDSDPLYLTVADCPGTVTAVTLGISRGKNSAWADCLVTATSEAGDGITITDAEAGSATITLTDDQLEQLSAGSYFYSVKVTIGGTRRTVASGTWTVKRPAHDATIGGE